MQPIGSTELIAAYHRRILGSHDAKIQAYVTDLAHRRLGAVELEGGQIDLRSGTLVRRTAAATIIDGSGSLRLDPGDPWEAAPFAGRMIEIRHTVSVPGFGDVTVIPFIGPIVALSRDGITVKIEAQDKSAMMVRGRPTLTVRKGMNAVAAIERIARACGERHFRLPQGTRARLPKSFSVGWADESSPWLVMSRIGRLLGMQLLYSCDGYLTLRRAPSRAQITLDSDASLTSLPAGDQDLGDAVNIVRVNGRRTKKSAVYASLALPNAHSLSPTALARNGAPWYMPAIINDSGIKSAKAARAVAANTLAPHAQLTRKVSASCVPFYHLDTGDLVRLVTPDGSTTIPMAEASMPLGTDGDMTIGATRPVSSRR